MSNMNSIQPMNNYGTSHHDVLILYADEDIDFATEINNRLENHGLTVYKYEAHYETVFFFHNVNNISF